jgi:hypothetical protein
MTYESFISSPKLYTFRRQWSALCVRQLLRLMCYTCTLNRILQALYSTGVSSSVTTNTLKQSWNEYNETSTLAVSLKLLNTGNMGSKCTRELDVTNQVIEYETKIIEKLTLAQLVNKIHRILRKLKAHYCVRLEEEVSLESVKPSVGSAQWCEEALMKTVAGQIYR